MKKASILAIAAMLTAAGAAHAQVKSPLYVEGNVTAVTTDLGDGVQFKPRVLSAVVGYDVHPNVAIEGMLGLNAGKGTATISGVNTSLKYTSSVGVFVKPHYAINSQFDVFARLGYVSSRGEVTVGSASATGTDRDFAYGLGGNYNIDKNLYATLGYMVFYKKDGAKTDGFNVGVGYHF